MFIQQRFRWVYVFGMAHLEGNVSPLARLSHIGLS